MNSKPPVVIAGFDESRYTPFLPACRYTASQDAVGMGSRAGKRIIEKIREKKTLNEDKKPGERVTRLPVIISHPTAMRRGSCSQKELVSGLIAL
jgi:DNA-binding LacI/PurR family transcriptional regulator